MGESKSQVGRIKQAKEQMWELKEDMDCRDVTEGLYSLETEPSLGLHTLETKVFEGINKKSNKTLPNIIQYPVLHTQQTSTRQW